MSEGRPSVEYQVAVDDLVAFFCFGAERPPSRGRKYRGALIQSAFLSLLCWGFGYATNQLQAWLWPGIVVGVFAVPVYLFISWPRAVWKNAKAYADRSTHLGWHRLSLEADLLREESVGGGSTHAWTRVLEVISDRTHLFVMTGQHEGFVVPRTAFPSAEEADRFAAELSLRAGRRESAPSPVS